MIKFTNNRKLISLLIEQMRIAKNNNLETDDMIYSASSTLLWHLVKREMGSKWSVEIRNNWSHQWYIQGNLNAGVVGLEHLIEVHND